VDVWFLPWNHSTGLDGLMQETLLPSFGPVDLAAAIGNEPDSAVLTGAGRWFLYDGQWKLLDKAAQKDLLPRIAQHTLGHPRELNRRMTMRALGALSAEIGTPQLRTVLAGSVRIRSFEPGEEQEPGGMVGFRPGDDEVLTGSERAVAALLLAKFHDRESLPEIRRLADKANGDDKAILQRAIEILTKKNTE
jgi:hypothetical protein